MYWQLLRLAFPRKFRAAYHKRRKDRPLYEQFKQRERWARKHKIPFKIKMSDFYPLPTVCPALGVPLHYGGKLRPNTASIDRLSTAKGYTRSNTAIISYRANRIKNDATTKELEKILKWMKK